METPPNQIVNNSNNNNPNPNIPHYTLNDRIMNIYNSIPLFVFFIICITIFFYIIDLIFFSISFYISNIVLYTIFSFQIWRLLTTVFMTTSILNILFAMISWVKNASSLENSMGTIKYMLIFFLNSISIQIIYCLILLIGFLISRNKNILTLNLSYGKVQNSGLWPIIMAELTLLCMSNPESLIRLFFFPCEIKAKFYPFILFFIFLLLNFFEIDFGVLSGIIYGLLYHFFFRNSLQISDKLVQKIEKSFIGSCLGNFKKFIPFNINIQVRIENVTNTQKDDKNNKKFVPFQGEGVKVGGSYGTKEGEYDGIKQNNSSVN